ncbi:SusC/RagA family TonB-linked outer membrane protein [Carboxylicivirga mesophila]|uniref:SusC/RagA family TonB-linked outer membrane protein n=1 Tax=Carboxylicivirga mesophila TaxID=1166478 RepID=A0ABS5K672_9BACT|nr:SusC/RagA family TonB-linked outer membrane protein [Carboxylicivirga mesophila]MBS2210023.1 SusC/RagA family TonB-linked outer membrane protein [Carboxylicivirga mesophila]
MKLTVLFLVIVLQQTFAIHTYSQSEKLDLNLWKNSLKEVFQMIEKKTDYSIIYDEGLIQNSSLKSGNYNSVMISGILDEILADEGLRYQVIDKMIVILKDERNKDEYNYQERTRTLTGKVVDAFGEPLIGVSVYIKSTTTGTITSIDGSYSLQVKNDDVIVFSFIGFEMQEVGVSDRETLDITLVADMQNVNEVTVTALGIKRETKALGYAVQDIKGTEIQKAKESNVISNLTGKVAGLTVYNSSDFFSTPKFYLRGAQPLIVIDGVPVNSDFWDVSSEDIEEMSILKGATASALYGSRGANGAIMITTKKGKAKKLTVDISSSTMFKAGYVAIPKPQQVYGTGDNGQYSYVDGKGGGINDSGTYVWGPRLDERDPTTASGWKEIAQWDSPLDENGNRIPTPWRSRGRNNLTNFLETGFITNNNISVSQSTEKGSFRISMSHAYEKGQVPNTKLNNSTFTIGGTTKIGDKFNLESSWTYNRQYSPNYPYTGYGGANYVYNLLVWSGTDYDIRDFRDYWLVEDVQQKYYQYTVWYNNPYFLAHETTRSYYKDVNYGFVNMTYDLAKDLKLAGRIGSNWNSTKSDQRTPKSYGMGEGNYSNSQSYYFSINSDVLLTYKKDLFDGFTVDALLGGTMNYWESKSLSASTDGLNVPGFFSLSNSTNPVSASNYFSRKQVNSAYGKVSLSYLDGLYLDMTGRNDWSSSLPEDSRSYFYPSVALSGIISEFVNMPDAINFWKVRGSWTVSKKDVSLYSINPAYTVSSDVRQGNSAAYYPSTIVGSDVEPEVNRTYELGTDISMLSNRLRLDVAYFNTLNYNKIAYADISDASGFSSKQVNTDEEFEQKGVEVVLSVTPIKTHALTWDASLNWSTSRWYLKKADAVYTAKSSWIKEDGRTDYIIGYDWERDNEGNIVHNSSGYPVSSNYPTVFGYVSPDWVWGFTNNFTFKNFDLSFSFDGRVGGDIYSQTNQAMWNSGTHPESVNVYREAAVNGINNYTGNGVVVTSGEIIRDEQGNVLEDTRVFEANQTQVSYISYMKSYNPYVGSMKYQNMYDQTFLKLRELSLTYKVPSDAAKKLGMSAASIAFIGRNLWLWTKEVKYIDPDNGSDNLSSASVRNVGFNIKLTF